jgi:hypothetical protein
MLAPPLLSLELSLPDAAHGANLWTAGREMRGPIRAVRNLHGDVVDERLKFN